MGTASELIAELRQLVEEGATPSEIVDAISPALHQIEDTVVKAELALQSVTSPSRASRRVTFRVTLTDAERARRYRENLKAKQGLGKANDVPNPLNGVTNSHAENVTFFSCVPPHPLHTNGLSKEKELEEERKKESKNLPAQARARARGTRLQEGSKIPTAFFEAGLAAGLSAARVGALWNEFVDYWCAVPGDRGCKLNWLATWRNRLRKLKDEGKLHGRRKSVHEAADDLIARIAEIEKPVRLDAGEAAVRLLPPR